MAAAHASTSAKPQQDDALLTGPVCLIEEAPAPSSPTSRPSIQSTTTSNTGQPPAPLEEGRDATPAARALPQESSDEAVPIAPWERWRLMGSPRFVAAPMVHASDRAFRVAARVGCSRDDGVHLA
jgi:hypothetical protein